ncbi:MAG: PEP-CTERM sorting domain-containing protein [Luteolibacter sp.]
MKLLIALAAALVVATTFTNGQNLSFDLTGGTQINSSTRTFTSNGVTATATAFSYTGNGYDFFEVSKLGQYGSSGLGVTNKNEDGSDPGHRVDNYLHNDYIIFTFDSLVDVTSIKLASIVNDSDVSYWVGNVSSSNLSGETYTGLSTLGFQSEIVDTVNDTSLTSRTVTINAPNTGVNAILFGARRGVWTSDSKYIDQFKVKTLNGVVVVPEPSTALLSLLGVVGICFRRRR